MRHLAPFLNPLYDRYHDVAYLSSDPLEFVHRYESPEDQEIVALLAAVLAYGKVQQIRKSVASVLELLGRHGLGPAAVVARLGDAGFRRELDREFGDFVHRFNVGSDLVELLWLVHRSTEKWGSVGAHFVSYLDPEAENFGSALTAFIADWRQWREAARWKRVRNGRDAFDYLLTEPGSGSCCKRWCMFLRWMGRRDRLDLGLWMEGAPLARRTFPVGRFLMPSQLVIPLDTHTGRISQYLGLTQRKSLNWMAAVEVTAGLRESDEQDPVRYDFALARLGILDFCQRKYRAEICVQCPLEPGCRFALSSKLRAK